MIKPAFSDFRLYYSNALDVLAGVLAHELRTPANPANPLTPDTVLIPQAAMRRWLQATLAQRHGVVANIEFLAPGEFVRRALDANVPGDQDDLDSDALHWRVYAALADPSLLAQPAMAQMAGYLRTDDPLKAWTLAGELARVFEKYQAWRRDWLLRWEAGADANDPQAVLWRHVAHGRNHRARRIHTYLDRFEGAGKALPQGLPSRLFAFATINISPDVLRVIASQARVGTTHFFMPTPTQNYWGDLTSLARRLREGESDPLAGASGDNRLLQAWGAAGRDFVAVLGSYEVVHPSGEIHAHADPAGNAASSPHGHRDRLLHRLQGDLLHRRPAPPEQPSKDDPRTRLPAVRTDDPSLQVHACHTRLRELQVLHDQLRALFEDTRFEPPLQPREIAVLAPNIDDYAPYLEAVFGAGAEHERIPYAVADTSPLAGEPLAEVFVHLLGLPVSRFGLTEILDLIGSAPIATAAGLGAPALERLRGWLQKAGARWGLDARHRAAHQAPSDDAYTWQFALDRLLLGHATGSDGGIVTDSHAMVAPLPELEGSALDALDTLLRLLRVLARQQQAMALALTPAQWCERLLDMLAALLPNEPADAAGRRALDRLRKLIGAFAAQAEQAGFDTAIPPELVRHHFASALAEADTRAPLLTGGVSFGRMVPMRLLPFRVICVLGMNDGDYPRRDPAAGLNRLTAELGTSRRRHGDRSLREDDRFLFLQLFAAAQDVFYLSYLGADPRDGSLREPSVLVSELIDEAARQHADPKAAAKALLVRHPLQPFAPGVFGGGDEPRRFSYRRQWHSASGSLAAMRRPLSSWFDGTPLAVSGTAREARLSLEQLRRFLLAPAHCFLDQLGVRTAELQDDSDDREPLLTPSHGLDRHTLQHALFETLLHGGDEHLYAALRARALLPSGAFGRRGLETLRADIEPYAQAFTAWRGAERAQALALEVDIDGIVLHGRVREVYPNGIARLRFGVPNGPSVIRNGLDALFASAAGMNIPLVEFHDGGDAGIGPHLREAIAPEQARKVLRHLLAIHERGLHEPLSFAPYSGWALYQADTLERGLNQAAKQWHGGEYQFAEGDSDALRLALRGRDPFSDHQGRQAFAELALSIFMAVHAGQVHEGLDADALHELANLSAFEPEDAP